ncbi:MAG TPA: hypothetical protein VFJ85_03680 [Acidimicrobiales bacterium]|nr:hypothetical protein [Acidimicrobiales bacterium]
MSRRKLIFFASTDPQEDTRPAWTAYHFAGVAAGAGLEAEVRLAGDAVRLAKAGGIPDTGRGAELRTKVKQGAGGPFDVSL